MQNAHYSLYFRATIVHSKSTNYKITTSVPPGIAPDPECGSMKGCLSDCNTGSCTYQITWKASGNLVRFEFQQLLGNGDIYQALGLSDDVLMVIFFSNIIRSMKKKFKTTKFNSKLQVNEKLVLKSKFKTTNLKFVII